MSVFVLRYSPKYKCMFFYILSLIEHDIYDNFTIFAISMIDVEFINSMMSILNVKHRNIALVLLEKFREYYN